MSSIRKKVSDLTEKVTWQVDYSDSTGTRRAKNFKTKRDAEAWRTKTDRDLQLGLHTPDAISISVSEAGKLWIEAALKRSLERSTINQYKTHLKYHINPPIGHIKLSRLTPPAVEEFLDDLLTRTSQATAGKVMASLRALIKEAQRRGHISQNVAQLVRRRKSSRDKPKKVIPTKDEIRKMIGSAKGRWKPFFVTAIFTGMRASELRGLRWTNVDLIEGIIHVCERADQWRDFGRPKSGAGTRDIPIPQIVIDTLKVWRKDCPKGDLDLVFPNGKGNVESHANIYNRGFAPLLRECDIVDDNGRLKFTIHALRHACASLMIEQGMIAKRIQKIMGHSQMSTTIDTYGHIWDNLENDKRAMAEIQNRLLE